MVASWPVPREPEDWEADRLGEFKLIQEVVRSIRNIRAEKNIKPGKKIPANLISVDFAAVLEEEINSLAFLAHLDLDQILISEKPLPDTEGQVALVAGPVEIYLPLEGLVDIQEEQERITQELEEIHGQIERLEKLLSGPFVEKAPDSVVIKEQEKLADYKETAATLQEQLSGLDQGG
jgi:valyl-tRNA synthetase